eukprot:TRINITY_DN21630_c0_g1_i1.p1 TRINITY_DN21630_c0_g1~~TRINITY_DN21630_c0_g1_i1.p1  ORF type:complete len:256 (+),score=37.74 TRINITY_DN21630_c0_g1_i1:73-840(+)
MKKLNTCVLTIVASYVSVVAVFVYWGRAVGEAGWRYNTACGALFAMVVWCYVMAVVTHPGRVPPLWKEENAESLPLTNGRRRWCQMCMLWKPPRSHHCTVCGACVLKYNHHCPWIHNCVGYYNYKYFLLSLTYTTAQLWVMLIKNWRTLNMCIGGENGCDSSKPFIVTFYVAYVSGSVLCLLLSVTTVRQYALTIRGATTVEASDRTAEVFNLGVCLNLKAVFGCDLITWPFPLPLPVTNEGGVYFRKAEPALYS